MKNETITKTYQFESIAQKWVDAVHDVNIIGLTLMRTPNRLAKTLPPYWPQYSYKGQVQTHTMSYVIFWDDHIECRKEVFLNGCLLETIYYKPEQTILNPTHNPGDMEEHLPETDGVSDGVDSEADEIPLLYTVLSHNKPNIEPHRHPCEMRIGEVWSKAQYPYFSITACADPDTPVGEPERGPLYELALTTPDDLEAEE